MSGVNKLSNKVRYWILFPEGPGGFGSPSFTSIQRQQCTVMAETQGALQDSETYNSAMRVVFWGFFLFD